MTDFDERFEERAGIVEEGCKVDRKAAERITKQQMGLDATGADAERYAFKFD